MIIIYIFQDPDIQVTLSACLYCPNTIGKRDAREEDKRLTVAVIQVKDVVLG